MSSPTDTRPSPTPGNNGPQGLEFTGPSVYLYGFLATLVLIFLVSIGVAWRGFHTRRLLRRRIDDALARGILMPGYDPENPHLPLTRLNLPPRPIMYETWIHQHRSEKEWDIKPTSLTALKPFIPDPPVQAVQQTSARRPHWLDSLRQYWFVTPPAGTDANQLQGRPARNEQQPIGEPPVIVDNKDELSDVQEVMASVLIAMPQPGSTSRPNSYVPPSSSRPGSYVPVASGSRPTSSIPLQEDKELPPLVLGIVTVPLVEKRMDVLS